MYTILRRYKISSIIILALLLLHKKFTGPDFGLDIDISHHYAPEIDLMPCACVILCSCHIRLICRGHNAELHLLLFDSQYKQFCLTIINIKDGCSGEGKALVGLTG